MNTLIAMYLAISLFLIFLVIVIKSKTHKKTKGSIFPLPPGPRPWPIVGCVPQMWRNRPADKWVHTLLENLNTDIACIRLGNVHVIPVKSPEIAREFLKKNNTVFASRPTTMATEILSRGFLAAATVPYGDQWKKMRKMMIADVFNHSRVRWLLGKRNEEADNLVKFVYSQCASDNERGSVVNVRTAALLYSGGVMRKMMFGTRYFGAGREDGGPGVEEEEYVEAHFTILLHVYAFSVSDYLPWLGRIFDVDGHQKKVTEALKVVNKYQDPIINERLRQWREMGMRNEAEDLLDVFISLKGANGQPLLSDEEIKAQITELLLATFDNPYNATEWALSEMLNQPEMLAKAVEELDRVVGKERFVQEYDLPRLPYVRACAREALRLHPVAPFNLPHVSTTNAVVAGYFIPKGSWVLLSRLGLGRNPQVWENPLRFNPDRHLNGDTDQLVELEEHELKFITFTTGMRGCIGGGLGTIVIVMLLARLLQGFTWSMPPNADKIDLTEAVSLFKAKPLYALAKPRLPAALYLV